MFLLRKTTAAEKVYIFANFFAAVAILSAMYISVEGFAIAMTIVYLLFPWLAFVFVTAPIMSIPDIVRIVRNKATPQNAPELYIRILLYWGASLIAMNVAFSFLNV